MTDVTKETLADIRAKAEAIDMSPGPWHTVTGEVDDAYWLGKIDIRAASRDIDGGDRGYWIARVGAYMNDDHDGSKHAAYFASLDRDTVLRMVELAEKGLILEAAVARQGKTDAPYGSRYVVVSMNTERRDYWSRHFTREEAEAEFVSRSKAEDTKTADLCLILKSTDG